MSEQDSITLIEKFIEERNYLSAYLGFKEFSLPREAELEYIGKLVQAIIADLGFTSGRKEKEKVYFYRSLLLMIFQDIPGLARIYKRQLQSEREQGFPLDFLKQLSNLSALATDKSALKETIEDTVEDITDKIEEAKEGIKDGDIDNSVKNLFSLAEQGIKEGVKGVNDFFIKITAPPPVSKTNNKNTEPIVDEPSSEKDEMQPGSNNEGK